MWSSAPLQAGGSKTKEGEREAEQEEGEHHFAKKVGNAKNELFSKWRGTTCQTILSFKLQRACWKGERHQTRNPLNIHQSLYPLHFGCNMSNMN